LGYKPRPDGSGCHQESRSRKPVCMPKQPQC
jgi:hypothetical protein